MPHTKARQWSGPADGEVESRRATYHLAGSRVGGHSLGLDHACVAYALVRLVWDRCDARSEPAAAPRGPTYLQYTLILQGKVSGRWGASRRRAVRV